VNETIYYECNEENYKFVLNELNSKDKEIERLHNIIKQYEEYLIASFNTSQDTKYLDDLMKLKELKGSDKEWQEKLNKSY